MIQTGEMAPEFSLKDAAGKTITLQQFRGKSVVLYFYPKDDTPGCTRESCSFRDSYEDFKQAGAEVIGVSSDSEQSHAKFQQKHRLPFILLSDPGGKLRNLYGVSNVLGLIPGRVTFVINPEGKVVHVFNSLRNAVGHVSEALQALKSGRI